LKSAERKRETPLLQDATETGKRGDEAGDANIGFVEGFRHG
jgi:hypothetical protein